MTYPQLKFQCAFFYFVTKKQGLEKVAFMKNIKIIEFYTPQETARLLKVSAPTLRKYCGLITKAYGKEYFKRDASNARLYSDNDIKLLKRIVTLKKTPHITLENAVNIALSELNADNDKAYISVDDTSEQSVTVNDIASLQNYEMILNKQSEYISQLMAVSSDLIESNVNLSKQVETLSERLEIALNELETTKSVADNKQGWLARLFKKDNK